MAADEEESHKSESPSNSVDNQTSMENVEAEGDVQVNQEFNQSVSNGGTVIRDPNNQNAWIEFCEMVSNLPISEDKLVFSAIGTGGVGTMVGFVWLFYVSDVASMNYSAINTPLILTAVFAALLVFGIAYVKTDEGSQCPKCGERFALRTPDGGVRKTGRTEVENGSDIIHGKRERECRVCGYSYTETAEWPAEKFRRQ